MALVVLQY